MKKKNIIFLSIIALVVLSVLFLSLLSVNSQRRRILIITDSHFYDEVVSRSEKDIESKLRKKGYRLDVCNVDVRVRSELFFKTYQEKITSYIDKENNVLILFSPLFSNLLYSSNFTQIRGKNYRPIMVALGSFNPNETFDYIYSVDPMTALLSNGLKNFTKYKNILFVYRDESIPSENLKRISAQFFDKLSFYNSKDIKKFTVDDVRNADCIITNGFPQIKDFIASFAEGKEVIVPYNLPYAIKSGSYIIAPDIYDIITKSISDYGYEFTTKRLEANWIVSKI